ncbi:MAG: histidine kinase, partial [Bacteroidota bacterium]
CKVEVNNELVDVSQSLELGHRSNELEISLCALTYRNKEDITYRYIFDGIDQDTVFSKSGEIRYPQLPAGQHTFHAAISFDQVHFSPPVEFQINVANPFWSTWPFFALLAGFLVLIAYLIFVISNSRKEKENKVKRQLVELRSRALRSQMNPHFTHNALNSIQSLIATKQNKEASIYLAEFAQLMRRNLNASSSETHSLLKELQIVESYQKLEKLRFKEAVEFEIHASEDINTASIIVPSMIIQPLVENSLIHGILPKEAKGKISTIIQVNEKNELFIIVEDDGVGVQEKSGTFHDSKALSILKERIGLIDEANSLSTISPTFNGGGFRNELKIQL